MTNFLSKVYDNLKNEPSQQKTIETDGQTAAYEPESKITRTNPFLESAYEQVEKGPQEELEESTSPEYFRRQVSRVGARIAETPFDILESGRSLLSKGIEKGTELITGKELGEEGREKIRRGVKAATGSFIPTGEEIREKEKKYAGSYLEPKTAKEKEWDEITQDTAGASLPFPGAAPIRMLGTIVRAFTGAYFGQKGKQIVKERGGSETAQEGTKAGAQLLASLFNPRLAANHINDLYQDFNKSLPQNARGDARNLERYLSATRTRQLSGTLSADERLILDESEALLGKIQNGQMNYEDAINSRISLNKKSQSVFKQPIDKAGIRNARRGYTQIRNELNRFIGQMEHQYPDAYRYLRRADEAHGVYQGSRAISNFVSQYLPKDADTGKIGKLLGATLFGGGAALASVAPKAALGIGVVTAGVKAGELTARILRSPELRSLYFRALRQATSQNAPSFLNTMHKFEEKVKQDPDLVKFLESNQSQSQSE